MVALKAEAAEAKSHTVLDEEVLRARILKKWQRRTTCALIKEKNGVFPAIAGPRRPKRRRRKPLTARTTPAVSRSSSIHFASFTTTSTTKMTRAMTRARAAVDELSP